MSIAPLEKWILFKKTPEICSWAATQTKILKISWKDSKGISLRRLDSFGGVVFWAKRPLGALATVQPQFQFGPTALHGSHSVHTNRNTKEKMLFSVCVCLCWGARIEGKSRFEWKEMQKGSQGNARKDDQQNITKRESANHVCIYTCIMIALNLAFPKQMRRLDSKWLLKKRLVHDIIPTVRPPSATCSLKWKLQALDIFQLKTILNHTSEAFWLVKWRLAAFIEIQDLQHSWYKLPCDTAWSVCDSWSLWSHDAGKFIGATKRQRYGDTQSSIPSPWTRHHHSCLKKRRMSSILRKTNKKTRCVAQPFPFQSQPPPSI